MERQQGIAVLLVLIALLATGLVLLWVLFGLSSQYTSEYAKIEKGSQLNLVDSDIVPRVRRDAPADSVENDEPFSYRSYQERSRRRSDRSEPRQPELPVDLISGLALHLPFDEPQNSNSFDDYSINDNRASCTGDACPISGLDGRLGRAVEFDGVNDILSVPHDFSYHSDRALTISVWVNSPLDFLSDQTLLWKSEGPDCENVNCSNREFIMSITNGSNAHFATTPSSRIGMGQLGLSSRPTLLQSGNWHHLAGVIDISTQTMYLYVNGNLVASRTDESFSTGIRSSTSPLNIGAIGIPSWGFAGYHGSMDELRIYTRALNQAEIRALASQSQPAEPLPDLTRGLALQLSFDELNGTNTFNDNSGNSNNALCVSPSCPISGDMSRNSSAVVFDGSDDILRVAHSNSYHADDLTISTWMRLDSLPSSAGVIAWKSEGPDCPDNGFCSNREFILNVLSDGRLQFGVTPSSRMNQSQIAVNTRVGDIGVGRWHHVSARVDRESRTVRIYVDGVLRAQRFDDSLASGVRSTNGDMSIGAIGEPTWGLAPFNGSIDDFRIYTRGLQENEITLLAGR